MLGALENRTAALVARALRPAAAAALSMVSANVVPSMDAGATINSTIDAAVLASPGGAIVRIPDGNFTIETSILHKSGIWLQLSAGTILTAKLGLNAPVIKNATAITEKAITNIANVGRVATVTCVAHGYVVGDWAHISGASPEGYNGWHKVITAPTADTFTYYVDKNIVADSGVISVFKAVDSNLKISGGKIVGNALNNVGDNNGVKYEGVKDFEIESLVVDGTYHNGVSLWGAVAGKLFRVRADNVIAATSNGILLGASSTVRYADDIEIVACSANANAQDGIIAERGKGIRIVASGGQYNGLCAIKIGKASDVRAVGCWGKYNTGNGLQIQPSGGNKNITVALGDFCENGEAGIQVNNTDAANPLRNVTLIANQCHRNGQAAGTAVPYGIAFELNAGCVVDRLLVQGNQCDEQTRGLSFNGDANSITNASLVGNRAKGNTADANFTALATASLRYGFNDFATLTNGGGLVLPGVAVSTFAQILGKSAGKITAPADLLVNTLATIPVPANVLGSNGQFIVECEFTFTVNANNKTLTVAFDGTNISNVVDTNQGSSYVKVVVSNDNATGAQRVATQRIDGSTLAAGSSTLAKDTTVSRDITITCQKAVGGDSIILESYRVLALVNS